MECPHDPFREKRQQSPVLSCDFQGESVPMILRHADLRDACRDWETYSSDAPFRVPIPSEEDLRRMRQLPIEVDPPEHKEYRKLVEPYFNRPKNADFVARVEALIEGVIDEAVEKGTIETIRDFALPIQSRALTYLLDVPESEADIWIGWGIHVFKDGDGESKGQVLEDYLQSAFDRAEANPGDDFFSALIKAEYQGRALTRDEMMGFGNLTFAGGRDTVIFSIATVLSYLAKNPEALPFLAESKKHVIIASEEIFRVSTPLTHIGRVCPVETDVLGTQVPPKGRVSLCWASANNDETVFDSPEEVRLDRKPNPHVAFGFGPHFCLGAAHARLIVRTLLQALADKSPKMEIVEEIPHIEREAEYERINGYESLTMRFS